eukprot:TRINITY_DN3090_c0_g2_i1.p1 TRINITY_DN3090_c0_g2~~TRINITY_DN3090_c0_g2_i1.p1  ORF type:complete len:290 (+),score=24.18 TRINITY_DN3090_c0_g2_i1:223-1092(+)
MLRKIEGLENCRNLKELSVSEQRIGDEELSFDGDSIVCVSGSLQILESERNNHTNLDTLWYLENLQLLKIKGNKLETIEAIEKPLATMRSLRTLDLRENPLEKSTPKLRDMILMMNATIDDLNDKKVMDHERQFLFKFYSLRKGEGHHDKDKKALSKKLSISGEAVKSEDEIRLVTDTLTTPGGLKTLKIGQLNAANDFRSNVPFTNTKHVPGANRSHLPNSQVSCCSLVFRFHYLSFFFVPSPRLRLFLSSSCSKVEIFTYRYAMYMYVTYEKEQQNEIELKVKQEIL